MSGQTNALSFFRSKNVLTSPNCFEPVQIVLDVLNWPKHFGHVKVEQGNSFDTAVGRYENLGACCNPIPFYF